MARETVVEAGCCGRRPLECSQQLLGVFKYGLRKGSITKCFFIRCSIIVQLVLMEAVESHMITPHMKFGALGFAMFAARSCVKDSGSGADLAPAGSFVSEAAIVFNLDSFDPMFAVISLKSCTADTDSSPCFQHVSKRMDTMALEYKPSTTSHVLPFRVSISSLLPT